MTPRQPTAVHQFHRHPATPWAELRVSQLSPHCFRLHAHDEYSIGIVDAGRAMFNHARGPEPVGAGSVILMEPGCWHACNPEQLGHWAYRMLFVQADWVHTHLHTSQLRFGARALHTAAARDAVNALCQPLALEGDTAAHTQLLLQSLLQFGTPIDTKELPATDVTEANAVHHALQQLHDQPDAGISVQALASAAGMSASRFIRHFKGATGVTPGTYRLNLRINGARRLLAQGEGLANAAHRMGFADQAHMQRAFKAYHSLTPGTYARA